MEVREGNRNTELKVSRRRRENGVLVPYFLLSSKVFISFASVLCFVLLSPGFADWDSGLESLCPNSRLRKLVATTLRFKPPHMDSTGPKPHQRGLMLTPFTGAFVLVDNTRQCIGNSFSFCFSSTKRY